MGASNPVVIGMDPHKRSATVEVMDPGELVLDGGRFGTDPAGFDAMLALGRRWPDRVWAVEGCEGIGRHLVIRLLDAGEQVIDVPAKLSARMRVYATGQGRKTDATDAHSIAHRLRVLLAASLARTDARSLRAWAADRFFFASPGISSSSSV